MTTPENLEDLAAGEQLDPTERDVEAPVEDAHEQAVPVEPEPPDDAVHRGLEVNEYDAVEQSRVVPLEDDYR